MSAVLVLYQAFPPDPAAGGQCVADVCATLADRGTLVTVVAADRGYDDPSQRFPRREHMRGFDVRRVGFASFGKASLLVRLAGGGLFVAGAAFRGLLGPRPDVVVAGNSPPIGGLAGLAVAAWHRAPLVYWLMDVNPDAAIAIGLVKADAISARLFDWLNRLLLRRAHTIVVMDEAMAHRMAAKDTPRASIVAIPPWGGPLDDIAPSQPGRTFRSRHGIGDRFVVDDSGNHNLVHPLTTLLDAAERLKTDDRFVFVFVGGGRGKAEVEARNLPNVLPLPYQPRETLADSLAAADIHVVVMGNEMTGIVHPSKIYGVLAVGRPVFYLGPPRSHVADIVDGNEIGWSVRHGDVNAAVAALQAAAALGPAGRDAMGVRARAALERDFPPDALRARVADLVLAAVGGR